jgi:ParB family chromosome partitioning protein
MGTIADTTKGNIFFIAADDSRLVVITNKSHKLYDDRIDLPLNEAMIKSIENPTVGILEPIIVRKVNDSYEVIDGRQRVRCAREAQRRNPALKIRIPFIIRTSKDSEAAAFATITNVQRTEDNPVLKGKNASRLLEMGHSKDDIVSIFGVQWSTIDGWIKISDAPAVVQEALESGQISTTQAVKVSRNRDIDEALENAKKIGKGKPGRKKGSLSKKEPSESDQLFIALQRVIKIKDAHEDDDCEIFGDLETAQDSIESAINKLYAMENK